MTDDRLEQAILAAKVLMAGESKVSRETFTRRLAAAEREKRKREKRAQERAEWLAFLARSNARAANRTNRPGTQERGA